MVNIELASKVIQYIETYPQDWNQMYWIAQDDCGTALCFAGLAFAECRIPGLKLAKPGDVIDDEDNYICSIRFLASHLLGLTDKQADVLFHAENTLIDLKRIINEIHTGVI